MSTVNPDQGSVYEETGKPRTARRGRHVVVGLRTGTPDAEANHHDT